MDNRWFSEEGREAIFGMLNKTAEIIKDTDIIDMKESRMGEDTRAVDPETGKEKLHENGAAKLDKDFEDALRANLGDKLDTNGKPFKDYSSAELEMGRLREVSGAEYLQPMMTVMYYKH
jgi:hypothetical protein